MEELLEVLIKGEKIIVEQWIELFEEYLEKSPNLAQHLESIDSAIHFTNAVKSGMCFPYFPTMLLNDKAIAFSLDRKKLSNYENDDFGIDIEKCSSLKFLTPDPCFYLKNKPKVSVQDSLIELSSFRKRISGFSSVNSYDLGCLVSVIPYGLPTENVSLPKPLKCKGSDIMVSWLKEYVKSDSPFELEAKYYKKFGSFFKVPGLKVYFPVHNFGDVKGRGLEEVKHFQKYFAEKIMPKLEKLG
ncbi:MAG: hypothetical protein KKA65_04235 [Nanoarchaeota archaeon]|nr:hypothetical protein [Nanoarchaeota archaeon]MBU4456685.1 hypothetical protein [Nanoarchaeota archaeon]MCG2719576.1 hypothetical protein [Nanoarchaeota archaeon]